MSDADKYIHSYNVISFFHGVQMFVINYDYFIILALSPPSKEILITSLIYFTKKVTCGSLCEILSTLIFRFPNFNLFAQKYIQKN